MIPFVLIKAEILYSVEYISCANKLEIKYFGAQVYGKGLELLLYLAPSKTALSDQFGEHLETGLFDPKHRLQATLLPMIYCAIVICYEKKNLKMIYW